jgi:hypothetical protein
LRHVRREVATLPIRMVENQEFDNNINGGEDNINNKINSNNNNVNKNAAALVPHMPELVIPDGVVPATANFLKMQMTMMQTLMATQMAQMERRLNYETRERQILARDLAKCDSGILKIVGKALKFDIKKDKGEF